MLKRTLVLTVLACGAPQSSSDAPRVLIEAAFLGADEVRSAPTLIARDGETARVTVDDEDLAVTSEVLSGNEIRLDIRMTHAGTSTTTSCRVHDAQTLVIGASTGAVIVRPTVIRDDADLRHAYERNVRERLPLFPVPG